MDDKIRLFYQYAKHEYKNIIKYMIGSLKNEYITKYISESGFIEKDTQNLKIITKPGTDQASPVFRFCAPSIGILTQQEYDDIRIGKTPLYLFTHTDLDGQMAGAVVRTYFDLPPLVDNFVVTRYNYSGPAIKDTLADVYTNDAIAFITDLNLHPNILFSIIKIFKKVIWVDHHLNSLANMKTVLSTLYAEDRPNPNKELVFIIDTRFSAAMNTFLFLSTLLPNHPWHQIYIGNDVTIPDSILLTSMYDTHNLTYMEEYTRSTFLNQFFWDNISTMQVESAIYKDILNSDNNYVVDKMVEVGKQLFQINQQKLATIYKNTAVYTAEKDGIIYKGLIGTGNVLLMAPDKDWESHCNILIKFANQSEFKASVYSSNSKISELNLTKIIPNRLNGHRAAVGMNETFYSFQGLVQDVYKDRNIKEELEVKVDNPRFDDERVHYIFQSLVTIIHHAWKEKKAV